MAGKLKADAQRSTRTDGALAILATAERLFGQFGLNGVTIRQITLAAGMANNSAVAYHFGDREGLLKAICEWRVPELEQAGEAAWRVANAAGRLDDPSALIGVLLRPFLTVTDAQGNHVHAGFMHQMLRSALGRSIRVSIFDNTASTVRALNRLEAVLPGIPPALLRFRLRIAGAAFFDGLCEWDTGEKDSTLPDFTLETLVGELIAQAAVICANPAGTQA